MPARMFTRTALTAACILAVLASARADVRDGAGFFSPEAVKSANDAARELKQRHGKEILVETYDAPPADGAGQAASEDRDVRQRYFEEWARTRFRESAVNGIYILICRRPGRVETVVGNQTERSGLFTEEDRKKLAGLILGEFRRKRFDDGLREGVDLAAETIRANAAKVKPVTPARGRPGR